MTNQSINQPLTPKNPETGKPSRTGVGKQSRAGTGKQSPIATRIGVDETPEPQAVVRRIQRGSD